MCEKCKARASVISFIYHVLDMISHVLMSFWFSDSFEIAWLHNCTIFAKTELMVVPFKWNSLILFFLYFFCAAVLDYAFQWLSTSMFGKFLSTWKCFLLIWTSFCMDWEGWLVEQVQDSGLQLTKFVLYPLCCRFFLMFPLLWIISLVVFGSKSFITKPFQQCLLRHNMHIRQHTHCYSYQLFTWPCFRCCQISAMADCGCGFFNNRQMLSQ